ncbi:MAG: hypothetical protein ACI865_001809 [Flavobacteriaceae bacterium]|jgi:hypothetical protein
MIAMKKYSYALIAGILLVLPSCGDNAEKDNLNSEPIHEEHNHDDESIELDNGKKWIVVDEMMGHVRNMESDLNVFENQDGKDYQSLAVKLENNIELLTSSCTMTGKAHDELHKWLIPYIDRVDQLTNAKNDEEAGVTYRKIQVSFKTFNTYFV